ncbi:hypothetical protein H1R20_g1149, partial [Candolleomyces eurysporus]
MGRTRRYRTEDESKIARRKQRLERSLRAGYIPFACAHNVTDFILAPSAKEARRKENRQAYAKRKVIEIPQLSDIVIALASEEIAEHSLEEHIFVHHSTSAALLELPGITLTDTDFERMLGHPPYPLHIVGYASFEKEWPKISAAFHGYVTQTYALKQIKWGEEAASRDRASLASELSKTYQSLTEHWKKFNMETREHCDELPTEFITFQNQLWFARRLTWLVADMVCLAEGQDVLLKSVREQFSHFV